MTYKRLREKMDENLKNIHPADHCVILATLVKTIISHLNHTQRVEDNDACLDELLEDLNRYNLDPTQIRD